MFTCQKCRHPLQVDSDGPVQSEFVEQFTENPMALSLGSVARTHPYLLKEYKEQEKKAVALLGESFLLVKATPQQSPSSDIKSNPTQISSTISSGSSSAQTPVQSTNLDKRVTALTNIFEVASDKCQYDHPLCVPCSELINLELERRCKDMESEKKTYESYLERLPPHDKPEPTLSLEEQKLEAQLEKKLLEIEKKREALRKERKALEEESKQLDEFELRFWEDHQDFTLKFSRLSDEHSKIRQQVRVNMALLNRLKKTNVYDDAFHISYEGHFGTINGFRLGRLPAHPVDWQETNAGLGQVILLLHTIAKHCDFKFEKYRLIPMGSFSKVGRIQDQSQIYELSGSNDISLGRLFWYRRFDLALIWVLACIKELGDHAGSIDKRYQARYPIEKDQIGNTSIKLQFQRETDWTKALKYMLTNLKSLLIWCAQYQHQKR